MLHEKIVSDEVKHEKFELSRTLRLIVFLTFVALSIIMSGDNGVVSSSSKMIKHDLHLSDSEYGIFGSLPSTGRIFGSLLFMGLLAMKNRKLIVVTILVIHGGAFFLYLFTKNKWILLGVRFIIGTVRVFPHIYIPVWVDQFGIQSLKTLMMTVINITSPLGQVVGFAIGTFNVPEKWPQSFALVGIIIWAIGSILVVTPSKYFYGEYQFIGYEDGERLVKIATNRTGTSIFSSGNVGKKKHHEGGSMLEILKSGTYLCSAYSRANLLFIFQVIHLFIKDYVNNGLKVDNASQLLWFYGMASVFGPSTGGFIGGIVSTKLGGYDNKNSVFVCIGFGFLTLLMTFPLAFASGMVLFSGCLFLFFFCSSAILPTIVGYIISSVPKEHKGAGSSLNLLITTLMGNLPGPICYGFINDRFKETNPTFAWKCTIFYFFAGFGAILLACSFRYKELSKREKPDKEQPKTEGRTSDIMADVAEGTHVETVESKKPTKQDTETETIGK